MQWVERKKKTQNNRNKKRRLNGEITNVQTSVNVYPEGNDTKKKNKKRDKDKD
ncbi:unnamed protein product [Paramecium octaurelia]|uniref:Uncharacterized protein n=1 Tax=Paramecium octaurelia TaxID=43137 RepID=A0A8S1S4E8_PAROT|nr:unnamed protein product [Paramecium octaurelia]